MKSIQRKWIILFAAIISLSVACKRIDPPSTTNESTSGKVTILVRGSFSEPQLYNNFAAPAIPLYILTGVPGIFLLLYGHYRRLSGTNRIKVPTQPFARGDNSYNQLTKALPVIGAFVSGNRLNARRHRKLSGSDQLIVLMG